VGLTQGAGPVKIYHPDRPHEAVMKDAAVAGWCECAHIGCHVQFHRQDSRQKYCDEHGTPKWAAWRTQQRAKGESGAKDAAAAAIATPHPAILPSVPKPDAPPPMPPQPFMPALRQKPPPPEPKPAGLTVTPAPAKAETKPVEPASTSLHGLSALLRQAADALDAVTRALTAKELP
jgi:hypothetical protein